MTAFNAAYSARRGWFVWWGTKAIQPTPCPMDPGGRVGARRLADALNRVYAPEPEPVEVFSYGADEHHFADGSPRPDAWEWFEAQRAEAWRRICNRTHAQQREPNV